MYNQEGSLVPVFNICNSEEKNVEDEAGKNEVDEMWENFNPLADQYFNSEMSLSSQWPQPKFPIAPQPLNSKYWKKFP